MDKDWLVEQYITKQLDCVQIGRIVNRDPKTVWYWLKKFAIPTRPRGVNYKQNLLQGQRKGSRHTQATKDKVGAASRARGAVPYLKNGVHHLKGKRGAVVANWKGGITPERQAFYRSPEWKSAVKMVWQRDNAICQRCAKHYRTVDRQKERFHIHHIESFEVKELRATPSNLVLLCNGCHLWIHSRKNENHEFIKP